MHHFHGNQTPYILVKLAHQEIHVDEVVELPAFADHGVAQDIAEAHGIDIVA